LATLYESIIAAKFHNKYKLSNELVNCYSDKYCFCFCYLCSYFIFIFFKL